MSSPVHATELMHSPRCRSRLFARRTDPVGWPPHAGWNDRPVVHGGCVWYCTKVIGRFQK
jgi:hypothetical protein